MQRFTLFLFIFIFNLSAQAQTKEDSLFIRKIFDEALTDGKCYEVLGHLCKNIGPRLAGMKGSYDAIQYMKQVMESQKFDEVVLQEISIPRWIRGDIEQAHIISKGETLPIKICALGGTIATPEKGIEAEVIEVFGIEDLKKKGMLVKDKIVFYNMPLDPKPIYTFNAYGACVGQRYAGAIEASKLGAIAVIVRSVTHIEDDFPHTGTMAYDTAYPQIPAVAVSTLGAKLLSNQLKIDAHLKLNYIINSSILPDTASHNVIGQFNGLEKDKYIIVGGHLDAWDNGEGAHDDGAGCVHSIEALRLLHILGYRPKHNLRAVMFMNEENGNRGGIAYAEQARLKKEKHLAAIESDRGGFVPRGFHIDFDEKTIAKLQRFKALLEPYNIHIISSGGSGVDISPMKKDGVMLIGFVPDSQRYFDYHHAESDTFDKINQRELELGAASIAALIYLLDKYSDDLFQTPQSQ